MTGEGIASAQALGSNPSSTSGTGSAPTRPLLASVATSAPGLEDAQPSAVDSAAEMLQAAGAAIEAATLKLRKSVAGGPGLDSAGLASTTPGDVEPASGVPRGGVTATPPGTPPLGAGSGRVTAGSGSVSSEASSAAGSPIPGSPDSASAKGHDFSTAMEDICATGEESQGLGEGAKLPASFEGFMATGSESALAVMGAGTPKGADVAKGAEVFKGAAPVGSPSTPLFQPISEGAEEFVSGDTPSAKAPGLLPDTIPDLLPAAHVSPAEVAEGGAAPTTPVLSVSAWDVRTIAAAALAAAKTYSALFLWLGLIHFNVLCLVLILLTWPHPGAVTVLVLLLTSLLVPVTSDSRVGQRVAKFVATHGPEYFPMEVVFEDKAALNPNRAYVIAFEPHHILPIGAMAFCPASGKVPLPKCRCLGSSALDWVPLCRHVWRWLGVEAVTRSTFAELLTRGTSCVVVPGGMRESLLIEEEKEVLYLKNRKGFVRMAVSTGSPIVPVFAFGQRKAFKWAFPSTDWHTNISKKLLFAPMAFWGVGGGPIPFKHPMTIVVGRPIEVELKNELNSKLEDRNTYVDALHKMYLRDLEDLHDKYKKMAGAEEVPLVIH